MKIEKNLIQNNMNNALTKTLTAGLMHGLNGQLIHDLREEFYDEDFVTDIEIFNKGSVWTYAGYSDVCLPIGEGDFHGFLIKHNSGEYCCVGKSVKPFLFPMSALTKEIEFKGERFVPTQDIPFIRMWWKDSHFEFLKSIGENEISSSPFRVVEWLIEHHFNVFNLSPEEFIEVNETNNPYKV